jgi:hypothetical protein
MKLFHRQTKVCLWRKIVSTINVTSREILLDQNPIPLKAFRHFGELYKENPIINMDSCEDMLSNIPHIITPEDNSTLCKPISK